MLAGYQRYTLTFYKDENQSDYTFQNFPLLMGNHMCQTSWLSHIHLAIECRKGTSHSDVSLSYVLAFLTSQHK